MGLGERIKEFAPVKKYFIYKRINHNPPAVIYDNEYPKNKTRAAPETGFKERIALARAHVKGKKLIFEALEKFRNSELRRTDTYFSIYNTPQVNDEIYGEEQQLLQELINTLRQEFQEDPYDREREIALDTMEIELSELITGMDRARRNVCDDRARRVAVWEILEEIPKQNFNLHEWERLKNLNDKYWGTKDQGLKNIGEAILWKSKKLDYQVRDAVKFAYTRLIPRNVVPSDFVLKRRIEVINHYFDNIIEQIHWTHHHYPMRSETREQLLEKQWGIVTQIKKDFERITREWEMLRRFFVYGNDRSRTETDQRALEAVYDSLCILEERYKGYDNGRGLAELERMGAKLGIIKLTKRNLQERSEEAKSEQRGEAVRDNEEINKLTPTRSGR